MTEVKEAKAEIRELRSMKAELSFVAAEAGYKQQKPKFPIDDYDHLLRMERTMKSNVTFANLVVNNHFQFYSNQKYL